MTRSTGGHDEAFDHFERLTIYNFSIDYPSICRLEFNPKGKHDSGDIVFNFPDKEKIFITWGELEKARKKFQTLEEYAEHSVNLVKKEAKIFKRVAQSSLSMNSHKAIYNHISLSRPSPGLFGAGRTPMQHGTHSMHLYCEQSSRFFVIYALISGTTEESFRETFMQIVNSFRCH